MGKYFGTDGIRGKNERFDDIFLRKVVHSLYKAMDKPKLKVLIAGDTRESSEKIINIVSNLLLNLGAEVLNGGVLPTPAISYLTKEFKCDCSIVITASHNPYTDNGLKVLNSKGEKLETNLCDTIEKYIDEDIKLDNGNDGILTNVHENCIDLYIEMLLSKINTKLAGIKVAIDCANGATSAVIPHLINSLDGEFDIINACNQYSKLINENCGSTHLDVIKNYVVSNNLDYGIAYDGDGDRIMMVDRYGFEYDGDYLLAILAQKFDLKDLVVTVMANQGLINWAEDNNIKLHVTDVGDQKVYEKMVEGDFPIGGEQSGHLILRNMGMVSGDGILTSLLISDILSSNGECLDECKLFERTPQLVKNVIVSEDDKIKFKAQDENVLNLIDKYDKILSNVKGRLNIRASGTESLIRITLWGPSEEELSNIADMMANELKKVLEA